MKKIISPILVLFFIGCGGGGGGGSTSANPATIVTSSANTLQSDNFSRYQWYVDDKGLIVDRFGTTTIGGNDLMLDSVYRNNDNSIRYIGYNGGSPIIVQVVDSGVDANHEDLKDNMHLSSSYNADTGLTDPTPTNMADDSHGTNVAGIIGAVGYNNVGIKGVAPSSNISGFKFITVGGTGLSFDYATLERAWLTGADANNIAISNNSWGSCIDNAPLGEDDILRQGAQTLRDGKGRIYVFASGNGRLGGHCPNTDNMENANTNYFQNSQYSISVAAVTNSLKFAEYSTPGSNVLISGYSGDSTTALMLTTAPTGTSKWYETASEDSSRNYDFTFAGTSAAAPVVSGVLALVLEACPNLTYRDVIYLAATTAFNDDSGIDPTNTSWVENEAGWKHSNDYGFGLINGAGMIATCTSPFYSQLPTKQTINASDSGTFPTAITGTITRTINIPTDVNVEWVGLTLATNYDLPNQLEIKLRSPKGTYSELLQSENGFPPGQSSELVAGFRLSSVAFLDEKSIGDWQVEITTSNPLGVGNLTALSLEVVGY